MSARPLAEVYEELKELRRQGDPNFEMETRIARLRASLPDELGEVVASESDRSANIVRTLEVKTLADRVFGEEDKAAAWLHRPNASLSGQRPLDLLKDELGAAVVREMLERIDHGMFA